MNVGAMLDGSLLENWPFDSEWVKLIDYSTKVNVKSNDDLKNKIEWNKIHGEYSHESKKFLCDD